MRGLLTAIRLLTIFPTPKSDSDESADLVASLVWFPLVGVALGAIVGLNEVGIRGAIGSGALACAAAVTLGLLLTRGAHARGFMAMAGALFAARDRERFAELAASRWPTGFGLLLGVSNQLLRYALLLAIPPEGRIWALLLAGGLSRASIGWTCWRFPYANIDTGIGGYLATLAGARDLILAVPVAALAFGALDPITAICTVAAAWSLPHLCAMWVSGVIGGVNANLLDAVAEISEVACLCAIAGVGFLLSGAIG